MYPAHVLDIELDHGYLKAIRLRSLEEICPEFVTPLNAVPNPVYISNIDTEKPVFGCPTLYNKLGQKDDTLSVSLFLTWRGTDNAGNAMYSWVDGMLEFRGNNLKTLFESVIPADQRIVYPKEAHRH